jgi:hypothetical protein
MALPIQLQEQVDKAKELAEQLYTKKPEGEESTQEEAATDPAPEAASAAEDTSAQQTTQAVEQPQSAVAPSGNEQRDENNETYAQRWRSLQGVYNAQKRQLDETQHRLQNMEQLIAQMQQSASAAPAKQQAAPQVSKHVTEKDITEYGADMVEFARRVSREEVGPLAQAVKALTARIDQLQGYVPVVQQVVNTQARTAQERFFDDLAGRVTDWKEVNDDPRFHEWLLSEDPLSGLQRQTLLTDAHQALDVGRVANIFLSWKREAGIAVAPAAETAQAAAKASNVSKLEKQIAPGRASAATTPPAPAQKKQWTRAEIAQFYQDKMQGRFKGREAEARAMEADIFLAQREGRVALNAA